MSLEGAALRLIAALEARAASWVPCEASPGELAREFGGPAPSVAGRVMNDWFCRGMVLDALERRGVWVLYDRRRRMFVMERQRVVYPPVGEPRAGDEPRE